MTDMNFPQSKTTKARLGLLAGALLLALSLVAIAVATAPNAEGARSAKVLGQGKPNQKPTCPNKRCQAMGRVTGFQTRLNGKRAIFKAPRTGHLVAWSIRLAKPDNERSRPYFEEILTSKRFGKDPYARMAIMKAEGKARFTLAKQTPAVRLNGSLGSTPIFTLRKPMRVKKGRVLALTVPTWATNYVVGAGRGSQWLASRNKERCDVSSTENAKKSRPQQGIGSTRKYECRYNGERIIYWAYFVPQRKGGNNNN